MRRREVLARSEPGPGEAARGPAQQPLPMVGFLSGRSAAESASVVAAFQRGLAEAGFSDGGNIRDRLPLGRGTYAALPALAAELMNWPTAMIVAVGGSSAALAAKAVTSSDLPRCVHDRWRPSEARTCRKSQSARPERDRRHIVHNGGRHERLELLRELAPNAAVLAVVVNPNYGPAIEEGRYVQARGNRARVRGAFPKRFSAGRYRASLRVDSRAAYHGTVRRKRSISHWSSRHR